jgi:hypothetical protein
VFGKRRDPAEKLGVEGGVTAWATVIRARTRWTSGTNYENGPYTVGNNRHMTVELRVEPEGEEPFETKLRQTFHGKAPMEGFQAKVVYDPADHSRIAILKDRIHPPGITHEQAERSAARHAGLVEATAEGRVAEYLQEDIAARKAEGPASGRRFEV